MRAAIQGIVDRVLGRGEHAVTVPPMDGALKPNNGLEQLGVAASAEQPDNLAVLDGHVVFSSGSRVLVLAPAGGAPRTIAELPGPVTATCSLPSSALLVAVADGTLWTVRDGRSPTPMTPRAGAWPRCVTAMCFDDESGTVYLTQGSEHVDPPSWTRDLMSRGRSGSVWQLDPGSQAARRVARGLAFPNGIAVTRARSLLVSESWKHRLVALDIASGAVVGDALADIPGYPGRIVASAEGGFWLCVFAPRSQLIEFVVRERRFRERMMREIPEPFWVAPALASGRDFREAFQGGTIKSLGVLKPWAPTRSYGLLVMLDGESHPVASWHSRAGGDRHGVVSALELDGRVYVASRGGNRVLVLDAGSNQMELAQ